MPVQTIRTKISPMYSRAITNEFFCNEIDSLLLQNFFPKLDKQSEN